MSVRDVARGLDDVVDPSHLEAASDGRLAVALRHDPMGLVVLERFLVPGIAPRVAAFLSSEAAVFRRERTLYGEEAPTSADAWDRAPDERRFAVVHRLGGIRDGERLSAGAVALARLRAALARAGSLVGAILGREVEVDGVDVTSLIGDDLVRPHTHDAGHPFLHLSLGDGATADGGGAVVIVDACERVRTVAPRQGRALVFGSSSTVTRWIAPLRGATTTAVEVSFRVPPAPGGDRP